MGVRTGGLPCFYRLGLDGNDWLLLCHLYFIFVQYGFGVALWDDRSFMGGNADMRSLLIIGGLCVGVVGLVFFWGVNLNCITGIIYYVVH